MVTVTSNQRQGASKKLRPGDPQGSCTRSHGPRGNTLLDALRSRLRAERRKAEPKSRNDKPTRTAIRESTQRLGSAGRWMPAQDHGLW